MTIRSDKEYKLTKAWIARMETFADRILKSDMDNFDPVLQQRFLYASQAMLQDLRRQVGEYEDAQRDTL